MGNPASGNSVVDRPRLAYILYAIAALTIAAACVLWQEPRVTTSHAMLLVAGCEVAVAALVLEGRSRARVGRDIGSFIVSCVAEALFGSALAFAGAIVVFGQTKSTDRLGYFLAVLVVVPASVALSYRFSTRTEAEEDEYLWPLILIVFTVLALGMARISGSGHISLLLLLLLLAARALATLVSRTGLSRAASRLEARAFAVVPVLLALLALAFAPSRQLTLGHVASAGVVSLVVAGGWAALRPLTLGRGVCYAVDAVAVALSLLVIFQLALPNEVTAMNGDYFLGPANDILHGHPMLIGTFSQYGVVLFDALAGFFSIFTLGYGTLLLLVSTLTALQWATIYTIVRVGAKSQLMALLGVGVGVLVYVFGPVGVFDDYPSTGVLRFGLPWLVVFLAVVSARLGNDRYRRYFDAAVLLLVALAAAWSGEDGIYCLGTACAIALVNAASLPTSGRERTHAGLRALARLTGVYVGGILIFAVITRLAAGHWPDWGPYIAFIRLYTTGGLGAELIANWSPGLAIGALYAASAAVIVGILVVRPDAVRDRLATFRALSGITVLGILVFTYFLGRSDPNNLIWISAPFVALVFSWLGMASASLALRLSGAAMMGSVAFVAAILIVCIRPAIDHGFHSTALGNLIEHPGQIRAEVGTLRANPVVSKGAISVQEFVRSLPLRRPLIVLVYPLYQSEALFRLAAGNAVGTSNPCQEELSKSGPRRVLAAVRNLRTGSELVTLDGPAFGPLAPIQSYTLQLLENRFTRHVIGSPSGGLIAYSLDSVRPDWKGGGAVSQPGIQLEGAPGCG